MWFKWRISRVSYYAFLSVWKNTQFLPGITAVITPRLGNSDGKHGAQQKVLVLRHKQALSITLLRKSSRLCRKSLRFNNNDKCLSISVGGNDHLWIRWEITSATSGRQRSLQWPAAVHCADLWTSASHSGGWSQCTWCSIWSNYRRKSPPLNKTTS